MFNQIAFICFTSFLMGLYVGVMSSRAFRRYKRISTILDDDKELIIDSDNEEIIDFRTD